MAFQVAMPWHSGEDRVHQLTGVEERGNPTSPFLTPRRAYLLQRFPLIAIGTLDHQSRPWTSLWGGDPPPTQPAAQSVLGIRCIVDASFDPVVESIWKGRSRGEILKEENGNGRMLSALGIDLEERDRIKLFGKMVAGVLNPDDPQEDDELAEIRRIEDGDSELPTNSKLGEAGEVVLVVKILQSLGNCPKYINKKRIVPVTPHPRLVSSSTRLTQEALDVINKADTFFLSSSHDDEDMDTNIRGGPPGFLRAQQPENESEGSVIVWPEYSGNNLYQTLGNLMETPRAGLVIPDFETGDVLHVTGDAKVLFGEEASGLIAKTRLAVKLTVTAARFVKEGLAFRGIPPEEDSLQGLSPYNPRVRYLTTEQVDEFAKGAGSERTVSAKLVKKKRVTPTIMRYRFALADPAVMGIWKPGQHVALDFSKELDRGYSHMRDDDPRSLNDDFMRTFTVSSPPGSLGIHGEEFELMVRTVGKATEWLSQQKQGQAEVVVKGFGGDFKFDQRDDDDRVVGFVAAGIGITPLLGQMGVLKLDRFKLWWAVGVQDIGLVWEILEGYPALKDRTILFLTGDDSAVESRGDRRKVTAILESGLRVMRRRLQEEDLNEADVMVDDWYSCTAPALRALVQSWLPENPVIYENYNY